MTRPTSSLAMATAAVLSLLAAAPVASFHALPASLGTRAAVFSPATAQPWAPSSRRSHVLMAGKMPPNSPPTPNQNFSPDGNSSYGSPSSGSAMPTNPPTPDKSFAPGAGSGTTSTPSSGNVQIGKPGTGGVGTPQRAPESSTSSSSSSSTSSGSSALRKTSASQGSPSSSSGGDGGGGGGSFWSPAKGRGKLIASILKLVVTQAALVPLSIFAGKYVSINPVASIDFTGDAWRQGLLAALPIAAVAALLDLPKWRWVDDISAATTKALKGIIGEDGGGFFGLLGGAVIGTTAGVVEEITLRGLLMSAVYKLTGAPVWAAAAASAAVFGALHAATPMYGVLAGAVGAYFSYLWVKTGNLAVPIIAHAAYDIAAIAFVSLKLGRGGKAAGVTPPTFTKKP